MPKYISMIQYHREQQKKDTKPVKKSKPPRNKDFFQAHLNDDVYIKRIIAKKGGVGGIKLG